MHERKRRKLPGFVFRGGSDVERWECLDCGAIINIPDRRDLDTCPACILVRASQAAALNMTPWRPAAKA